MTFNAFRTQLSAAIPVLETDAGLVVQAYSAEAVTHVIQVANRTGTRVCPNGLCITLPPDVVRLDLNTMNQVRRYRHEELLVTVETGITIDQLSHTLRDRQQRLSYAYSRSRSLLSILGEETLSLSETRYTPLRYSVVGLEAVTGDGQPIHYGGEVVKNVTGYDLGKLFIGSRHRYGLLTAVTLKLEPEPDSARAFLFHIEEMEQALELLHTLERLLHGPEMLTLFKTKTTFGWQILLGLSGYRDRVQAESEAVHDAIIHLNADLQELYLAPKALDQWLQRLDWQHPDEPEALVLRVALPHKAMMDLPYRLYQHPALKSADMILPLRSNQMLLRWISVNMPDLEALLALRIQIADLGGFVEMVRVPPAYRLESVMMFEAEPQAVLHRWGQRLKQQFDPGGILPDGLLYASLSAEDVAP